MTRRLIELLKGQLPYQDRCQSFSPFYSRSGLVMAAELGVHDIILAYNRKVTHLTSGFLAPRINRHAIPLGFQASDPTWIHREGRIEGLRITERITGAAPDEFTAVYDLYNDSDAPATVSVSFTGIINTEPQFPLEGRYDAHKHHFTITGHIKSQDSRDPSPSYPIVLALALHVDSITFGKEVSHDDFTASAEGAIPFECTMKDFILKPGQRHTCRWSLAMGMGADATTEVEERVRGTVRQSFEDCHKATQAWLNKAAPDLNIPKTTPEYERLYAWSVHGLLGNTVFPHEQFSPYHACFPNRGTYASHYLWDTCFQSLAYVRIHKAMTKETLLLLAHRQEEDGKIPQFSCATWNRPGASQPPVLGWAAQQLFQITRDDDLYKRLYPALVRCHEWWFTRRDQDGDGLAEYDEDLESGWDNSPRWDHGRVEPLELNSFLIMQLRALADMADVLNKKDESAKWRQEAAVLARKMLERMYFADESIFYDIAFDSHEPIRIKTPASFIPLWADVPLPEDQARHMIETYLLSPDHFFGPVPFPVVGYSEKEYAAGKWWRGPVWINIAYLMTEVLRKYGYEKERREAIRRLLNVMIAAGPPYELYNSQTGEPMGASELGWSCSLAIHWIEEALGWE